MISNNVRYILMVPPFWQRTGRLHSALAVPLSPGEQSQIPVYEISNYVSIRVYMAIVTSSLNDDDLYNKEQDTWSNLIRRSTIDEREAIFDRMGLNKMHPKDRRMKLVYQSHAFLWSEFLGNRRRPPPPHVQWRPSVNLIAAIRTIMIPGHLTVLN